MVWTMLAAVAIGRRIGAVSVANCVIAFIAALTVAFIVALVWNEGAQKLLVARYYVMLWLISMFANWLWWKRGNLSDSMFLFWYRFVRDYRIVKTKMEFDCRIL